MIDFYPKSLDDRSNKVLSCEGPLFEHHAFWSFISDLSNLVIHKSVADIIVEDKEFLKVWTQLLKYMQVICYYYFKNYFRF